MSTARANAVRCLRHWCRKGSGEGRAAGWTGSGGEEGANAVGGDTQAEVVRLRRERREGKQVPGGEGVDRGGPYGHVRGQGRHDFAQAAARLAKDAVASGEGSERLPLGFADLDGALSRPEVLAGGAVVGVEVALVPQQSAADELDRRRGPGQVGGSLLQEDARGRDVVVGEGRDGVRRAYRGE